MLRIRRADERQRNAKGRVGKQSTRSRAACLCDQRAIRVHQVVHQTTRAAIRLGEDWRAGRFLNTDGVYGMKDGQKNLSLGADFSPLHAHLVRVENVRASALSLSRYQLFVAPVQRLCAERRFSSLHVQ